MSSSLTSGIRREAIDLASSIGGLGLSGVIHADSESAILSPWRTPAVSSNPEFLAPATLNGVFRRKTISDKSHLMINTLWIAAATQIFFEEDSTLVVAHGIGYNHADSNWLLRNHILELPVGHISCLDETSVFKDWLGLIILTGSFLHASVWVVSLRHHTILGRVSIALGAPSTLTTIICSITINQLLSRERSFILTANCVETFQCSYCGKAHDEPHWELVMNWFSISPIIPSSCQFLLIGALLWNS